MIVSGIVVVSSSVADWRRQAIVGVLSLIVLAGCGLPVEEGCGPFGACASRIQFNGQTYQAASAHSLAIGPEDLMPIGNATGGPSNLADDVVYALDDVDPDELVVMRLQEGSDEAYLLFSRGQVRLTPEFCQYYEGEPPAEC